MAKDKDAKENGKNKGKSTDTDELSLRDLLRVPPDLTSIAELDPDAAPGFPGDGKDDVDDHTADLAEELSDLQERLYAAGRSTPEQAPSILLLLQGLDTAGKGGVIRKAVGLVDPQGIQLTAFKKPTEEERAHHYLWRIEKALPDPGMIGIFDRSQYEDVLVARVENLVPEDVWQARYDEINEFEAKLAAGGTRIIKCFLNVSRDEQKGRLLERLANPEKYWKYNPGDVDTRLRWDDYQAAYFAALTRCNTDVAPWYAIPADKKWYRNWAVARLLLEELRELNLGWPAADFDVAAEQARVEAS